MGLRLNKDEFLKKEKVILPEDIELPSLEEEYDFDSFGDSFIICQRWKKIKDKKILKKTSKKNG